MLKKYKFEVFISKMKNLGKIAKSICILALMIASLIVRIRW